MGEHAARSNLVEIIDDARSQLVKLRRIAECIYDHHKENTDDGHAIMLDVIESHALIGAVETLLNDMEREHGS